MNNLQAEALISRLINDKLTPDNPKYRTAVLALTKRAWTSNEMFKKVFLPLREAYIANHSDQSEWLVSQLMFESGQPCDCVKSLMDRYIESAIGRGDSLSDVEAEACGRMYHVSFLVKELFDNELMGNESALNSREFHAKFS